MGGGVVSVSPKFLFSTLTSFPGLSLALTMADTSSPSGIVGDDSPRSPPQPRLHQRQFARDDFEFGSLLGIGALAQVVHVRDTYTSEEYALKILDKKQIKRVCCFIKHVPIHF